jgi:putative transposase
MPRLPRAAEGGLIYHALNRANGPLVIFDDGADYEAFLRILNEAVARHQMRLLAYCVLPDHFHLMLWPRADGDLSRFMGWLTLTHTQRWHAHRGSAGAGHLYQGRFKSFPVSSDDHFLVACRYVERNALMAGLVDRAEAWRWGSLAHPTVVDPATPRPPLSDWPIARPANWLKRVNAALTPAEEESFRRSLSRGQPFGGPDWQAETARRLGLESALRPRGRPKRQSNGT